MFSPSALFWFWVAYCFSGVLSMAISLEDSNGQKRTTTSWEFIQGWDHSDMLIDPPNTTIPLGVERKGIMFITQTGIPSIWRAIAMQNTWLSHVKSPDKAVHICGPECKEDKRLSSVLVYPSSLLDGCKQSNGQPCSLYQKAGLKLPFGLVHVFRDLVRRIRSTCLNTSSACVKNNHGVVSVKNQSLPKWWVLKDDDTYPIMENLKQDLEAHDPSKPLILANLAGGCPGACGAAGVVLSWSLAETLALKHGDEYIQRTVSQIKHGSMFWDEHLTAWAKEWVPSVNVINDLNLNAYGPFEPACTGQPGEHPFVSTCFKTELCECTRSKTPATFHIKYDFNRSLAMIEHALGHGGSSTLYVKGSFNNSLATLEYAPQSSRSRRLSATLTVDHSGVLVQARSSKTSIMRRGYGKESAAQRGFAVSVVEPPVQPQLPSSIFQETIASDIRSIILYQDEAPQISQATTWTLSACAFVVFVYSATIRSSAQRGTVAEVSVMTEDLPPLATALKGAMWMMSSILLTLFNKWIMMPTGWGFNFPITLSLGHMLVGSALLFALYQLKPSMFPALCFEGSGFSGAFKGQLPARLLVAMLFAIVVSTSNTAYSFLSVSSINLLKCGNPIIAFLVTFLLGMPERNRGATMFGFLFLMFIGCVMSVQGSIHQWLGLSFLAASIFVEQFRLCLFKKLVSSSMGGSDPLSALLMMQPMAFLILLAPAIWFEAPQIAQARILDYRVAVMLLLNAVLSVVLNIAYARLLEAVTSTTFTVWGVIKDFITAVLATSVLGDHITLEQALGYVLLVISFLGYNWVKSANTK